MSFGKFNKLFFTAGVWLTLAVNKKLTIAKIVLILLFNKILLHCYYYLQIFCHCHCDYLNDIHSKKQFRCASFEIYLCSKMHEFIVSISALHFLYFLFLEKFVFFLQC